MTTQTKSLLVVLLATVGLLTARTAPADDLSLAPSRVATVGDATGNEARVALQFDPGALPATEGLRIDEAFLEWILPIAGASGTPEVALEAITSDWASESGTTTVTVSGPPVSDWELTPLDRERNGGLVRLGLGSLVEAWRGGRTANHGVLVTVRGLSSAAIVTDAANCRLRIRYGVID